MQSIAQPKPNKTPQPKCQSQFCTCEYNNIEFPKCKLGWMFWKSIQEIKDWLPTSKKSLVLSENLNSFYRMNIHMTCKLLGLFTNSFKIETEESKSHGPVRKLLTILKPETPVLNCKWCHKRYTFHKYPRFRTTIETIIDFIGSDEQTLIMPNLNSFERHHIGVLAKFLNFNAWYYKISGDLSLKKGKPYVSKPRVKS